MDTRATIDRPADIRCAKCDTNAVAVHRTGLPLCARHATIFITVAGDRWRPPHEADHD